MKELKISGFVRKKGETEDDYIARFNDTRTGYLIHEIRAEKPYFQPCIRKEDLEQVWCVRPLMNNVRIIKQEGLFLLFGIAGDKRHYPLIKDWNKSYTEDIISQKVIIPIKADEKVAIRQQLRYLGVSEDKIYPDLEHITKYLKSNINL